MLAYKCAAVSNNIKLIMKQEIRKVKSIMFDKTTNIITGYCLLYMALGNITAAEY